ncbi:GNAT family N-acetyltransferase [Mycobacterium vicinigordonae]|uniref:GNAT family N-acetyltransferase n=1 Tax=Mycobacterium vicinigordonae TaxID=1719132 RepID=A0A7D6E2K1_9MYCO|nr:GNAT family N-acetyltransferase [Mycobacterium vicinigordonae]QLL10148.1 GNAT family N-acetyltransferase [Mycobacterium vicinigordonae]
MRVEVAGRDDVDELADVAARTFPLACPSWSRPRDIASFIDSNLSTPCFANYLNDPQRTVFVARDEGRIVGYAMLIRGVPDDENIQRAVPLRPAVELSKLYLLKDFHGKGASTALMDAALAAATAWGARCMWLGTNENNLRATRFYTKCGFRVNGTKTFQMGEFVEDDYVMVRELALQ